MMLDWSLPLAIATGSLAAAAFWAIRQNYSFRKREYRHRLLKEVIKWAIDIHKSSLDVHIPFVDMSRIRELEMQDYPTSLIDNMKENLKNQIETYANYQNLTAHAKAVAMNEYIKAIVKESFEKELLKETSSLGDALVKFLFIMQRLNMKMEYKDAKAGFEGEYSELIDVVNQKIEETNDTDRLHNEYAKDLARRVNKVLVKIAKIKSKL